MGLTRAVPFPLVNFFGQNLGGGIWTKVIRFGQNQNLAPQNIRFSMVDKVHAELLQIRYLKLLII